MSDLPAIHPGEIIREQYVQPLGLTAARLADDLGLPVADVEDLLAERAPVTPALAERLAARFNTTSELWTNMQAGFDEKAGAVRR